MLIFFNLNIDNNFRFEIKYLEQIKLLMDKLDFY